MSFDQPWDVTTTWLESTWGHAWNFLILGARPFVFYFCKIFAKMSKITFSLCHYGVLCVDGWENNIYVFHFEFRLCNTQSRGMNTFWRNCKLSYSWYLYGGGDCEVRLVDGTCEYSDLYLVDSPFRIWRFLSLLSLTHVFIYFLKHIFQTVQVWTWCMCLWCNHDNLPATRGLSHCSPP
jgi:hypothetical protein